METNEEREQEIIRMLDKLPPDKLLAVWEYAVQLLNESATDQGVSL